MIVEELINQAKRAGALLQRLAGDPDVIIASVTLPLIVLTFNDEEVIVPIEIRKDKDSLGWLYTLPSTTWVALMFNDQTVTTKLEVFKLAVEKLVKNNKRQYSSAPTPEFLFAGEGGGITTYVSAGHFFETTKTQ